MGFISDVVETVVEDLGVPLVVAGVGAAILAPVLLPVGKPLAKAAIKGGILFYEKSKGVFAEVGEAFEDILAEAKVELADDMNNRELKSAQVITTDSSPLTE